MCNVSSSYSVLRMMIPWHFHRLRKAQPSNRTNPSALFISVRSSSALFDLAIDA